MPAIANFEGMRQMMNCGIIPASWAPAIQALLRVATGLMFLEHGTSKFLHFPINDQLTAMYTQMGNMTTFTGVIELLGGIMFILGAFTRIVAFILSGFMAVAFWMVHFASSGTIFPMLNGGEAAALYSFIFLYFGAVGAGRYSMDAMRKN